MMTPDPRFQGPVRVSVLERLVPSFAFAIAAISGAVGGLMLFRFMNAWTSRDRRLRGFLWRDGRDRICCRRGSHRRGRVLPRSAILVSIIRLFTTNTTASPPGLLFLMTGLLSTVPAFALHYILHVMKGVVVSPDPAAAGGISSITSEINAVTYFAIGGAGVIAVVMLAFSFVPFSSRPGRKSSPLVCLMLGEILIVFLVGVYFWEARTSITERDKDRVEEFSQPSESPSVNSNATDLPSQVDDMLDDVNGASPDGGYSAQNPDTTPKRSPAEC